MLIEAIRTIPVPGAPPRFSRAGAWIGLAFLETALRQNHVRRITESLILTESQTAERMVEVDLSLSLLDDIAMDAGRTYSLVRARHANDEYRITDDSLVWVPIARLNRESTSPVDVLDSRDVVVPRLTQYETSRLLASGMYRLLRTILQSDPRPTTSDDDLRYLLTTADEARWLIQLALLTLFYERTPPNSRRPQPEPRHPAVKGLLAAHRDLACRVLMTNHDALFEFYQLLAISIRDYLVVVGLPSSKDEHHLHFKAALKSRQQDRTGRVSAFIRQLAPARRGYSILYSTPLPPTARSYHLVAQTSDGLNIERMILSSNGDESAAKQLVGDLTYLSQRLKELNTRVLTAGQRKILELELESSARVLAELVRRRRWEAEHIGGSFNSDRFPAIATLSDAAIAGLAYPDDRGEKRSSLLVNPDVTSDLLAAAATEVGRSRIAQDISSENDPVTPEAHAYWRRHDSQENRSDALHMQCAIRVTDAAAGATRSVGWFVASVAVITYAIACMLYRRLLPWQWNGKIEPALEPGAMITVLLLVPGFLYSRLELPVRTSIAARLRLLPRMAAYTTVGSVVLLTAYIAVDPSTKQLRWAFWMALFVQSASAACLLLRRRWNRRSAADSSRVMVPPAAPPWFAFGREANVHGFATTHFDARFEATGIGEEG
jgi:hypothetical protein